MAKDKGAEASTSHRMGLRTFLVTSSDSSASNVSPPSDEAPDKT